MHKPTNSSTRASEHAEADPYRAVFDAAPDGILLVDRQGTIVEANREALRLFGYEEDQLLGQPVEILVPDTIRRGHRAHREEYMDHPRRRPMGVGMELSGVRRDGITFPVEISLSPLGEGQDARVIAVVRDLRPRRRLKDFGAEALRGAEDERRRIARELHDETAQRLATLLIRLKILEQELGGTPAAAEVLTLRDALDDIVEGVRRIARGLRPPELEDVGLEAALRSFIRERFPADRIRIELDGSERRLDTERSLVVYRIAQEALSNASRHSGAKTIELRVREAEEGSIELEVTDDGRGFDLERTEDPGAGLGLLGMEERAELVDGSLEVESRPGEGTRIRLRLSANGEDIDV